MNNAEVEFLIEGLLKRPVAFHPIFAEISKSTTAGLLLSQAWYWTGTLKKERDGWFYKTQKDWREETSLTRYELEAARRVLKELGFIETELHGVPAKTHYRVNKQAIYEAIRQFAANQQTGLQQTSKLDCSKPPNKIAVKPQTISENKAESTTENKTHGGAVPAPDEFYTRFVDLYRKHYALPYTHGRKDFVQLAKLRKRLSTLLTSELIQRALVNYFATPQASHTLADLCVRFETFQRHALDRFGKPAAPTTPNQTIHPKEEAYEQKSSLKIHQPGEIRIR